MKSTACGVATFFLTTFALLLLVNLTLGNKQIDSSFATTYSVSDPHFVRVMGALLGRPVLHGNKVQALLNGDQIFPAMLGSIRGAEHSITLETYIYWSGTIGREFTDALIARAHDGVAVHVLLDWWGSEGIDDLNLDDMKRAGIEIQRYNPLRVSSLGRMNNRSHRKLLIVDGRIAFTGGVGIADPWRGDAQDPHHWRDTHFQVDGPVVAQLQAAFLDNWLTASGRVLHGQDYFPPLAPTGTVTAQVFTSAPGGGAESAQFMYLVSIAAARTTLRLSMAYFIPDDVAVNMLVAARKRGVQVQLILPGKHIDRAILRHASRFEWEPLLRAGVEIYEYQPTMYHCKVMIVDELWSSVGSTNFDSRSFSVNDEANLNVHDAEFARDQVAIFNADLQLARRITLADWEQRPWRDKVLDALAGTLSSQL